MTKIFVDGSAGTTGLRIFERLAGRKELEIIRLSEDLRKDPAARADAICRADIAFLCLPDAAAVESVALAGDADTRIIDTSTAHRVHPDWAYGFPELSGKREKIQTSKRVANPGCHASGFIALVAPLIENGLLAPDAKLTCFSLTGYTGGGKGMIAGYEGEERDPLWDAPRQYALGQEHKHLKEMQHVCGLTAAPVFCPIVADFPCGMEVTVPLFGDWVKGNIDDIRNCYQTYYQNGLIRYADTADENGFLSASAFAGRDDMQVTVCGNPDRMTLVARFDNLGKGASGAAVQNMNILLGVDESTGLSI